LIGCRVERFRLEPSDGFVLDPSRLANALESGFDLVVLVNPNNPTGTHVQPHDLASVIRAAPSTTTIWIDETYVDFVGPDASLECLVPSVANLVIGKSMSKAYALSGLRVAYLAAAPTVVEDLRRHSPPWAVSMPGVIAANEALRASTYYAERHAETRSLRERLMLALCAIPGAAPVPSAANFVLCRLPAGGPGSAAVLERCRANDVYLREFPDHPKLSHHLRIAVKDATTTDRIATTLHHAIVG
jgi:histidinol-phosphate/aromatic aminotransferase/cobyric acid decarboxylase-like protein